MGSAVGLVGPALPQGDSPARAQNVLAGAAARPARGPASLMSESARTMALGFAGAWLALVGGLMWWTNLPLLVGWHPRVILTGSMMPRIQPGDVVLVAPVLDPINLPKGRIVVVDDPSRPGGSYAHRIVRVEAGALVTRGDANPSDDYPAVTPERIKGEIRLVVPRVGLPVVWLREHTYVPLVLALAATWFSLVVALRDMRMPAVFRRRRTTA